MFNTKTDHFALTGVSGLLKLLIIKSCIISTPGVSLNYVNKGKCPTRIGRCWSYNPAKPGIYRCNLHFKVRLSYIQNSMFGKSNQSTVCLKVCVIMTSLRSINKDANTPKPMFLLNSESLDKLTKTETKSNKRWDI